MIGKSNRGKVRRIKSLLPGFKKTAFTSLFVMQCDAAVDTLVSDVDDGFRRQKIGRPPLASSSYTLPTYIVQFALPHFLL